MVKGRYTFAPHYLAIGITNKDHLVKQFSITTGLGPDFPKNEQQLLDLVVVAWQDKPYDGHEQAREPLPTQHKLNQFLQGRCLATVVQMLCNNTTAINGSLLQPQLAREILTQVMLELLFIGSP